MSLTPLTLPYNNFRLGEIIDPDEFNSNNNAIVTKINTMVSVITTGNTDPGGDGEDIFLPSYIKETYIDPVEIKSPLITGNTLLGSNGMVGMSSVGTTGTSVRIWAGSTNRDTAPFRVTHSGSVTMTNADVRGTFKTQTTGGLETSAIYHSDTFGGRLVLNSKSGPSQRTVFLGDTDAMTGVSGGMLMLFNKKADIKVSNARVFMGINTYYQEGGFISLSRGDTEFGIISLKASGARGPEVEINNANGVPCIRLLGDNDGASYMRSKLSVGSITPPSSNHQMKITGNLNIEGDLYINGVKMKLTPA